MRNLEFKARLAEPRQAVASARNLGADLWGDLRQTDTYFAVSRGHLKLRETVGRQGELIFYERDEGAGDRPSEYLVAYVADPQSVREALSKALGVTKVVRKRRTLLTIDTTRIHVDNVEGLGDFLEIEVPVAGDSESARERLSYLLRGLGYTWEDCVRASYEDLAPDRESAGEQRP